MDDDVSAAYIALSSESAQLYDRASEHLPGGDSRSVTYHRPFPSFVRSGSGCHLTTVDDRQLIDFVNNYTQTVLGHAPDPVVEAVETRFRAGNGLGAPTEELVDLAAALCSRVPSIDTVRFANSGTEATLNAIRAAMAYTGNEAVLKVRGGYHGTHDTVAAEVDGPGREHAGIPSDVADRVHTVRFNDADALADAFAEHGDDLACFIVEPVLGSGGMIPAEREFLEAARDLTAANDALLVFDEVMTFRLALGGAQKRYDVTPDLTALGKLIGGGLPVGAFGGAEDVMNVFHPQHGTVHHSGTFNANPATMAGGLATLDTLDEAAIDHINGLGERIREGLQAIVDAEAYPIQITGDGSFFFVHFTDQPVRSYRESTAGCEQARELFLRLHTDGVFLAPRGMGNVSTPMGDDEVDAVLGAVETALGSMDPEAFE